MTISSRWTSLLGAPALLSAMLLLGGCYYDPYPASYASVGYYEYGYPADHRHRAYSYRSYHSAPRHRYYDRSYYRHYRGRPYWRDG